MRQLQWRRLIMARTPVNLKGSFRARTVGAQRGSRGSMPAADCRPGLREARRNQIWRCGPGTFAPARHAYAGENLMSDDADPSLPSR
jgi:hypothetical protein